jgi:hypothetical protein
LFKAICGKDGDTFVKQWTVHAEESHQAGGWTFEIHKSVKLGTSGLTRLREDSHANPIQQL